MTKKSTNDSMNLANFAQKQSLAIGRSRTNVKDLLESSTKEQKQICESIYDDFITQNAKSFLEAPKQQQTISNKTNHSKEFVENISKMTSKELKDRSNTAKTIGKFLENQIKKIESIKTDDNKNISSFKKGDLSTINSLKNYVANEAKLCDAVIEAKQNQKKSMGFFEKISRSFSRFLGKPQKIESNNKIDAILKNEVTDNRKEVQDLLEAEKFAKEMNQVRVRNNNRGGFPAVPKGEPKLIEAREVSGKNNSRSL